MHKKVSITASQTKIVVPPADRFWLWKNRYEFSLPTDTFEYSVSVAASIASYFLRQGLAVGMMSYGQISIALPAERGERQQTKILENLAFLKMKVNCLCWVWLRRRCRISRGEVSW